MNQKYRAINCILAENREIRLTPIFELNWFLGNAKPRNLGTDCASYLNMKNICRMVQHQLVEQLYMYYFFLFLLIWRDILLEYAGQAFQTYSVSRRRIVRLYNGIYEVWTDDGHVVKSFELSGSIIYYSYSNIILTSFVAVCHQYLLQFKYTMLQNLRIKFCCFLVSLQLLYWNTILFFYILVYSKHKKLFSN